MSAASSAPPERISLVEVGPRDGLQNEPVPVSTADKLELIRRSLAAGFRRIEVTSFVHPGKVPQMSDAEQVCAGLPQDADAVFSCLVLNRRGLARALATERLQEVGVVAVASDTFGLRNQGRDIQESLAVAGDVVRLTRAAGLRAQVSLAVSFGCPYEGPVDLQRVLDLVQRIADLQPDEIALADTAGVGLPNHVSEVFDAAGEVLGHSIPLRGHFHDTRNTGLANVYAALQAGVRSLDASTGGVGGCPFAAGATGNVASQDLLYLLHGMGFETGLDPAAVLSTARWLGGVLGRSLSSGQLRSPLYPPRASATSV